MTDIVERLRSSQPLPICPFDKKSPDYYTTPNDKPCKFCGGEPEGPDRCTGADTRIMGEAADIIDRLRTALSEAEQRARREALEEAAAIIDENMLCAADDGREVIHPRSNPGNKVGVAYAAAIRALIPSEPHDAEGRE